VRRERGQLAVGLAMAFTAVCAIFGLIFNSGMIAREKMRLQQTTDFAALVASDVQRRNLNYIRDRNQEIEDLYAAALSLVALPYAPYMAPTACASFYAYAEALTQGSFTTCNGAGHAIDHFYRAKIVDMYNAARDTLAQNIVSVSDKANGEAHKQVLAQFLVDERLPHGLRRFMARTLGQNPSPATIKSAYETGALSEMLSISDSKEMPLFVAAEEPRSFTVAHFLYSESTAVGLDCTCYGGVVPDMIDSHDAKAKVVRDDRTNYTTHFLVSATYSPPNTFADKTFAYLLKRPDSSRKPGESEIKDPQSQLPLRLFNVNDPATGEKKTPLQTMSLAKPYGGTLPTKGWSILPMGVGDYGKIGNEFKGSKLIGIADHEQLEGYEIWKKDTFQLATGEYLTMEDFLH
jgi:hypothetical protein